MNKKSYEPRKVAAEIRNENAHAVLRHPEKERSFCASEMHREAVKDFLGLPRDRNANIRVYIHMGEVPRIRGPNRTPNSNHCSTLYYNNHSSILYHTLPY